MLEKTQAISTIYNFFTYFESWIRKGTPVDLEELERYLTKDFQFISNGKQLAASAANYAERMETFRKKYTKFEISQPLEEPFISENQIVLNYQIDVTSHDNEHGKITIMAMGTIENNKIQKWAQVANAKGIQDWDC
jgi:hypothetical protein